MARELRWSRDDSTLLHTVDSFGSELLDSRTGEVFATINVSKPAALGTNEVVSPDLSYRISRGDGAWEIAPPSSPDDSPPEKSLARVLEEAGLAMRGVELVYAAPAAVEGRADARPQPLPMFLSMRTIRSSEEK